MGLRPEWWAVVGARSDSILLSHWSQSLSVVSDSLQLHGLYSLWNSPGQNIRVGSLSLLQGIFPIQGSNPGVPHYRQILYQLSHKGSPRILEWVAYPFFSWSSWPKNWTWISCIADGFLTNSVAQLVKSLPAMQETWVQSLGWEDPLEKEMATHSSILAWRIPWTEESGGLESTGHKEMDTTEWLTHAHN